MSTPEQAPCHCHSTSARRSVLMSRLQGTGCTLATKHGHALRQFERLRYGVPITCERSSPLISNFAPFMLTVPLVRSSISLPTSIRVTHRSGE
jgi:hypothetical protein